MKHRLVYGLLLVALFVFFWVPALVNAREARAEPEPPTDLPPVGVTTEPTATLRPLDDYAMIWGRNLPKIPLASEDLGLRLVGTVVADHPSKSLAIIENRTTGNQRAYREGDRLGEVVIKKILPRNVVIDTGMGNEMLSMYVGGNAGGFPSTPQMARLDREEVDSALPDYNQLMQQIRVRPHFQGSQPGGFLIYSIEPGSIFAKMGLENGDVIMAVNGEPITITQQAIDFYNALKEGGAVALEIKRGESTEELRFEIQ